MKRASLLFLAFSACSTQSASDFPTNKIYASIGATATGDGHVNVSATYTTGANSLTFIELTSDDHVSAALDGGPSQQLIQQSLLGVVSYAAVMTPDQGTVTVSLQRKKDSGAPSSTVTLPAPFTVTSNGGTSASRAQNLDLRWSSDPAATSMNLSVGGPCIQTFTTSVAADSTHFTINANTLVKATPPPDGGTVADSCQATANVVRTRSGTLDPGYAGGTVIGTATRAFNFTTTP